MRPRKKTKTKKTSDATRCCDTTNGTLVEEGGRGAERERKKNDKGDDWQTTLADRPTMQSPHESRPTVVSQWSNGGEQMGRKFRKHMTKRQRRLLPSLGFTMARAALDYSTSTIALRNLLHVHPKALISPQQRSPVLFSLTQRRSSEGPLFVSTVA